MVVETALATSLVTALATKAFEKAGEKIGEKTGETALTLIKGLFTSDELITLNLSAEALQDPKAQGKLEGKLEERLAANPDVARQLEELLKQIPAEVKENTITQIGNNNQAAQDIHGSTINFNR